MDSKTFAERGYHNKNAILYASDNKSLAEKLEEWCKKNDKKMRYACPEYIDLLTSGSFVIIVDRDYIGRDNWEDYCNICAKPGTKKTPSAEKDIDLLNSYSEFPIEERIILIEKNVQESFEEWPILPYIHEEDVFLVEQDNYEEIINILNMILFLL